MNIAQALTEASKAENWTATRIASETSASETTARRWLAGVTVPDGNQLMTLRRVLPGFADRLDGRKSAVA